MADNTIQTTGLLAIGNGGLSVPKFAFANVAASQTDSALVTAVSGKRLRVLDVKLSTNTATTPVTFNSKPSGAGTACSATFNAPVGLNGFGYTPLGHFETNSGEGLTVTTGAGNTVAVQITYCEV